MCSSKGPGTLQAASASLAGLLPAAGRLQMIRMLLPSSSLPLLQPSREVTPRLLKAWGEGHVLGTAQLLVWAGIPAGSLQRCTWGRWSAGRFQQACADGL